MMIEEPFRCVSIRIRIEHLDDIAKNQKLIGEILDLLTALIECYMYCAWIFVNFSGGAQQIFVRVIQ